MLHERGRQPGGNRAPPTRGTLPPMGKTRVCAALGCLGMALLVVAPAACCIESTCPESVVIVEAQGIDEMDLDVVAELGESIVVEVMCPANQGCDPPIDQGVLISRRADSEGEGLLVTLRGIAPEEADTLRLTVSGGGAVLFGTTELVWRQGYDSCSDTICSQANTETITLE